MSFDKQLKKSLEDITVPAELLPENIEAMLRRSGVREAINTEAPSGVHSVTIPVKRSNRVIIMRTIAAAAACVALAGGFMAFKEATAKPVEIEGEIEYKAVQVQSYDELLNIYTGIYLKNSEENANVGAENGDGVEISTDETAITGIPEPVVSGTLPPITEAAPQSQTEYIPPEAAEAVRYDFSDADIVKSSDRCIYYICSGTLYVVSKDDMAVAAEITGENVPFEMYISGSSLILISEENVSDGSDKINVCVDIYDISADTPVLLRSYKQNGVYTSVRLDDSGILYLVTGYSDYRDTPLDDRAELDSFVPGYYVDGEKYYVAAEDITIPSDASNTDYTVISAVKCSDPVNVSVKAVLGSSANAYCSGNTLYVTSSSVKNGRIITAVTSFDLAGSGLSFKAAGTVNGELISRYSMCEIENGFRLGCRDYDENGMIVTCIYTLDSELNVISSADNLLPGVIAGSVKFDGDYASITEKGGSEPVLVVDVTKSVSVQDTAEAGFMAAYVNKLNDRLMVGISAADDGKGGYDSLKLELYSSDSGEKLSEIVFAELGKVNSPALTDKKAMLVDPDNCIIGVPVSSVNEFGVKNRYYVFGCGEYGFTEKGVFEYNDIDDSYRFERAIVNGGELYIIGSGRVVSVRLSDMTVIDTFDFQ